jgi:hypothetical protein
MKITIGEFDYLSEMSASSKAKVNYNNQKVTPPLFGYGVLKINGGLNLIFQF